MGPTWEGPNENVKFFGGISDTSGSGDSRGWGQKSERFGSPHYERFNTDGPIHQPASPHEPPHAPDLHPLLPPKYHIGNQLLVSSRDKTPAPASSTTYTVTDWSKKVLEPPGTKMTNVVSRDAQPPNRAGTESQNVQSIRVKPPSKFMSSSPNLNQKPLVQRVNPQTENPHASVTTSSRQNLWIPQQMFEHRRTNPREDTVFQRAKVSSLQEPALHRIKPDQLKQSPGPSSQQQKWVPSLAETGIKTWGSFGGGDLQGAGNRLLNDLLFRCLTSSSIRDASWWLWRCRKGSVRGPESRDCYQDATPQLSAQEGFQHRKHKLLSRFLVDPPKQFPRLGPESAELWRRV